MDAPRTVPLEAALTVLRSQCAQIASDDPEADALIAAKCRALAIGYASRWSDSPYHALEVENTLRTALVNPETGRESRSFVLAGKLDVLALNRRTGATVVIDHKSTSDTISQPDDALWRELIVAAQPVHYLLLLWIEGRRADEALWDVMRKPTIGPRQMLKAKRLLAAANGSYCGRRLSADTVRYLAESDRENLELYEARLVEDCCEVRPEWYFQRRTLPRTDADLMEHAKSLWQAAQLVLYFRRQKPAKWQGPEARFPKHPGSCMNYGKPCPYLGLCAKFDTPESDRWQRKPQVHGELDLPDDGRGTLTYSSVRTLQSCPRKFYYAYELGIARAGHEESEALRFGNLWHLALESYWKATLRD